MPSIPVLALPLRTTNGFRFAESHTLALYSGGYFAEVFRGGFTSVPRGHLEAAVCLVLTRWQAIWRIELPQMLALITPALANLTIVLSKETAVLSIVTVPELTFVLTGTANVKSFIACVLAAVLTRPCAANRAQRRSSRPPEPEPALGPWAPRAPSRRS